MKQLTSTECKKILSLSLANKALISFNSLSEQVERK